jgi:hypothetical protein
MHKLNLIYLYLPVKFTIKVKVQSQNCLCLQFIFDNFDNLNINKKLEDVLGYDPGSLRVQWCSFYITRILFSHVGLKFYVFLNDLIMFLCIIYYISIC